jgi:predicted dinucleotide-binding enzyme
MSNMRVGILGSGLMGGKLGTIFARAGHEVVFSYARRQGVFEARDKDNKPSLVYCGDDSGSKEIAAGLIRDVGFDPVDAGPLRIARYTEPFALLVGQLAYEGDEGPELAYRFEWFGK